MNVWLIIDNHNAPGKVIAVMANEDDVDLFLEAIDYPVTAEERSVIRGQPSSRYFNP